MQNQDQSNQFIFSSNSFSLNIHKDHEFFDKSNHKPSNTQYQNVFKGNKGKPAEMIRPKNRDRPDKPFKSNTGYRDDYKGKQPKKRRR